MSRRHEERGATAVLTVLMVVVLISLSAFSIDFGMAYANKRQAQTAADAAVLSAAIEFARAGVNVGDDCNEVLSAGDAAARAAAENKIAQNDERLIGGAGSGGGRTATLTRWHPHCNADGQLEITVEASATSYNVFGGVASNGATTSDYNVTREATALVAPGNGATGLRPMALCSRNLPSTSFPSAVVKFEMPGAGGAGNPDCPEVGTPGNRWALRCPAPDNQNFGDSIVNGCANPVRIVPGQAAMSDLQGDLIAYCDPASAHPESCLTSQPGQPGNNEVGNGLDSLISSGRTFFLPAFCGVTTCSPGAVTTDSGSNTVYPVHRIIAVRLCGYRMGNRTNSTTAGVCANNPNGHTTSGSNQQNFMLLSVQATNVGAVFADGSCALGDPCDTGLRSVGLIG